MAPQLSFTLPKKFFLSERKAFLEESPSGVKTYVLLKFRKFYPTRPEGAEALSPGQRPGLLRTQTCRPVRAKALKIQTKHKAFALTGRLADCHHTQGDALGGH